MYPGPSRHAVSANALASVRGSGRGTLFGTDERFQPHPPLVRRARRRSRHPARGRFRQGKERAGGPFAGYAHQLFRHSHARPHAEAVVTTALRASPRPTWRAARSAGGATLGARGEPGFPTLFLSPKTVETHLRNIF